MGWYHRGYCVESCWCAELKYVYMKAAATDEETNLIIDSVYML
jgi:hypothetical protein